MIMIGLFLLIIAGALSEVLSLFFILLSYVSPLIMGAVIIIMINVPIKKNYKKIAPWWLNIIIVAAAIISCIYFLIGIFENITVYETRSIAYLIVFGLVAIAIVYTILALDDKYNILRVFRKNAPPEKTDDSLEHLQRQEWEVQEIWENYPTPDYDAVHTYCEVHFESCGPLYYYRTRNPELKVGDLVYVPVADGRCTMASIASMRDYIGHDAPYPLEKTKYILGKVGDKRLRHLL